MKTKIKLNLGIIAISIGLPLLAFVVGNLLKLPDDTTYWNYVVNAMAVAMIVVPLTLLNLIVTLIKKKVKPESEDKAETKQKSPLEKIVKTILLIIGALFIFRFANNMGWLTSITGYPQSETGFRQALNDHYKLVESGTEDDMKKLWSTFLAPQNRVEAEKAYQETSSERKNTYAKTILHNVIMDGDKAYADRTMLTCNDKECTTIINKSRVHKLYKYDSGHWYMEPEPYYCPRKENHELAPEFARAFSLIEQRYFANQKDSQAVSVFREILRCVDVSYSTSEESMKGAEGLFRFIPGQSTERLTISVSPRYKAKDDLLTATILSHELTHAVNYVVGLSSGEPFDCFRDEAVAFQVENEFLHSLNPEEKQSIISRVTLGGSPELEGIANTLMQIPNMKGATYQEKTLNFVKSNPYYQEQCKGR